MTSSRRWIGALCVAAMLVVGAACTSTALAATAGVLPPRNPATDCDRTDTVNAHWGIANINACRALEGIGPLTLPSNWAALTTVAQGFVLMNLERVNRGLPAIIGLSGSLSQLAAGGAANSDDPEFPARGFTGGGGLWAGAASVVAADYMWMYDDGPNGLDPNLACPHAGAPGCWMHRDIILWRRSGALVAGGGFTGSPGDGSFAYLVLDGYSTAGLTFTWKHELQYFAVKPAVDPLAKAAKAHAKHRRKKKRGTRKRPAKKATNKSRSSITITVA
ncbi:MAG TPA: hypothetical protein VHV75_08510 [Solirubrobacteraceae bacterium]|nr:hypothetical protein [Solirubrobacteraceae bacterium]